MFALDWKLQKLKVKMSASDFIASSDSVCLSVQCMANNSICPSVISGFAKGGVMAASVNRAFVSLPCHAVLNIYSKL